MANIQTAKHLIHAIWLLIKYPRFAVFARRAIALQMLKEADEELAKFDAEDCGGLNG